MPNYQSLIALTLVGGVAGFLGGTAALTFRWFVEDGQRVFLPDGQVGNYEALPVWAVVLLPTIGAFLLGHLWQRLCPSWRQVGILHVLVRLHGAGRPDLPWSHAVAQFLGGAWALMSGQSLDREGPSVHLGATLGNQIGRRLFQGPGVYALTVCGAAGAIAAAFNTPLAAVLFVIEVLRIDYRFERFIPIIAAAVVGAVLGRLGYGEDPAFDPAAIPPSGFADLPLFALLGLLTGLLAVLFVRFALRVSEWTRSWPLARAFTAAGLATGLIGLAVPQVLGISYDTLDAILSNEIQVEWLAGLVLGKLVATTIAIGVRMPGGLIGPSLIIGGAVGGLLGGLAPIGVGVPSVYATVGMVAMLSAVLQAPLFSLLALLELTAESHIILPGMVAIVIADLIARKMLGRGSLFDHMRRLGG